jgi:hypothetical protein
MNNNNLIRDLLCIAAGAAAGAGAMYWLDPVFGAERRAALRGTLRRPRWRARRTSVWPASRAALVASEVEDARLRDRVRARLDTLVSHPGAIDVQVEGWVVRLSGHVLAKEHHGLLFQVRHIPGVHRVINALTAHDSPESIVAAQSEGALSRRRMQPA